jgi:hypothetical protein
VHTSLVLDRIVPRIVVKKLSKPLPTPTPKPMPTPIQKLLPRYLNERELFQYNFTKSKIVWCRFNDYEYEAPKYAFIIRSLCHMMTFCAKLQYTHHSRNIIMGEFNERGFKYNENLRVSFRGMDANHALHEITNIMNCVNFNFPLKIKMKIRLEYGTIIYFAL